MLVSKYSGMHVYDAKIKIFVPTEEADNPMVHKTKTNKAKT